MIKAIQFGLKNYFYFSMSLLICLIVAVGFGPHLGQKLLRPTIPVPTILYWHALVFTGWVALFFTQTVLARTFNVNLHRRLGPIAAALGAILPILGIVTAFTMQNFRGASDDVAIAELSFPVNDMLAFATAFWLAIYWRRRVEFHRRLMFIATCTLMGAAFARFPESVAPFPCMYAYSDLLIVLGVLRDVVVNRRVHPVYLYGLPAVMLGQASAIGLAVFVSPTWVAILRFFVH
jgi:hypothetical protein